MIYHTTVATWIKFL